MVSGQTIGLAITGVFGLAGMVVTKLCDEMRRAEHQEKVRQQMEEQKKRNLELQKKLLEAARRPNVDRNNIENTIQELNKLLDSNKELRDELSEMKKQQKELNKQNREEHQKMNDELLTKVDREHEDNEILREKVKEYLAQCKQETEEQSNQFFIIRKMLTALVGAVVVLVLCVGIHFWFFNPSAPEIPQKLVLQLEHRVIFESSQLERFLTKQLALGELQTRYQIEADKTSEAAACNAEADPIANGC